MICHHQHYIFKLQASLQIFSRHRPELWEEGAVMIVSFFLVIQLKEVFRRPDSNFFYTRPNV